jgi:hypothetical protein
MPPNCDPDAWARGQRFLSLSGLTYVVADQPGIETDDEEARDAAVNSCVEARAALGVLRRPVRPFTAHALRTRKRSRRT